MVTALSTDETMYFTWTTAGCAKLVGGAKKKKKKKIPPFLMSFFLATLSAGNRFFFYVGLTIKYMYIFISLVSKS